MTPPQLAENLGVSLKTLYMWRWRGEGPPSIKCGRLLRYREDDVNAWLAEHTTDPKGA